MANQHGLSNTLVEKLLLEKAANFSFIQAYKLLCEFLLEQGLDPVSMIRLRPYLGLSLERTEVKSIRKVENESGSPLYYLDVNLPGLYGQSSPLPKFFTEDLMASASKDQHASRIFFDLIHQRLYQLLFEAKTSLLAHLKPDGVDDLHEFMLTMAGLRDAKWLTHFEDRAFILRNINLFRHQRGTAYGLKLLLENLFVDANVVVKQCMSRWLNVSRNQIFRLGEQASDLGESSLLGGKFKDTLSKLTVDVVSVSAIEYKKWVLTEKNWIGLRQMIQFFIGQVLVVELNFKITGCEEFSLPLNAEDNQQLGKNTWLNKSKNSSQKALDSSLRLI